MSNAENITPKHYAFSLERVTTILGNTLTELVRLKVFYVLLLFALLIIGSSFFVGHLTTQDQFQVLKDVSLGAITMFTWLLGLLSTAMLIPKDLEDRTLYTILAKPVHRYEYLLGKLGGVLTMLLIATLTMSGLFLAILYLREQHALSETLQQYAGASQDLIDDELRKIRSASLNWNLLPGITIIYVKSAILATLTLLLSTFSTSWIFTIIMSVMAYFIGHLQSIAREAWQTGPAISKVFLGLVALLFPDLQLFNLVDDIVVGNPVPLDIFWKTSGLGLVYFTVYLLLAQYAFSAREL